MWGVRHRFRSKEETVGQRLRLWGTVCVSPSASG